jgi:hypothetical protein
MKAWNTGDLTVCRNQKGEGARNDGFNTITVRLVPAKPVICPGLCWSYFKTSFLNGTSVQFRITAHQLLML